MRAYSLGESAYYLARIVPSLNYHSKLSQINQNYKIDSLSNISILFIDCCKDINVGLTNDVKDKQSASEGTFNLQGNINERNYYLNTDGSQAIWYV